MLGLNTTLARLDVSKNAGVQGDEEAKGVLREAEAKRKEEAETKQKEEEAMARKREKKKKRKEEKRKKKEEEAAQAAGGDGKRFLSPSLRPSA